MKRKLAKVLVVLAVLLLIAGGLMLLRPRDRITPETFKEIRLGMSEEEVVAILGGPGMSDKEANDQIEALEKQMGKPPFIYDDFMLLESKRMRPDELFAWRSWPGRRGSISVHFDNEWRVISKSFRGWRPAEPSIVERLRDWLGW